MIESAKLIVTEINTINTPGHGQKIFRQQKFHQHPVVVSTSLKFSPKLRTSLSSHCFWIASRHWAALTNRCIRKQLEKTKKQKKKKINTNKKETDEWISRRWQFSWAFPRFASVWRFGDENETTADVQVLWDDFHVWILSHFFVIFSRQKNPSAWKKTPAIFFRLIHTDDVHRSCTVGIILHQLCTES